MAEAGDEQSRTAQERIGPGELFTEVIAQGLLTLARGRDLLDRCLTEEQSVDDFGFDPELTDEMILAPFRPLYEKYFRVTVEGLANVPGEGGALVVANHSGTLPLDALMLQVALRDRHPARRALRLLAADLVFDLPVLRTLARRAGHTQARMDNALRLLERGELVGVMPEGYKGLGKPFAERYRLRRFGRGGFAAAALRTGTPIVPCAVLGAEEIYPMVADARPVARLLGLPYFPITPTFPLLGPLGAIPLPTKWTIRFGTPLPTDHYAQDALDDPMFVHKLSDEVRDTVQDMLTEMVRERRSVFG
ncbi:acyltransferase [Streptomyces tauricus]|uniref:Acyltransferase family protein n=1 Tax=Streptomyces tauricus TaxID=68274 RepID=A0ABZ1JS42_9ACTN|nr:lysophospholipid acyltransferase family protein [Streptomyces tauricus]MCW8096115.1 acyltransferase family protein [Streptomyces tauricus]GHA05887.1 acyltransferase [Streptomyces tauricus]